MRRYGASPLHLLVVLGCLALAGYAALQTVASPLWVVMLVWFAAAVVAHDLVLFPAYTAADRLLVGALRGGVNYVRVPLLGAGLTFAMFFPGILRQGGATVRAASGLDQQPYLARWLLLCAAMFVASALVLVVNALVRPTRHRHPRGAQRIGRSIVRP